MRYTINLRLALEFRPGLNRRQLRAAARAALKHQAAPAPGSLTLVIADDQTLRQLNQEYRGVKRPTDVLSFGAAETDPDTGARYFGDIAISFPRAQVQAQAARHTVMAELQLLVVHGVLHLLGHDHANAKDKARMWQAQREILELIG